MIPTRDQIERAAYDRWIRRDRAHGYDRHDWLGSENELTYLLNYRRAAEFALDASDRPVLGGKAQCRFCERTPSGATFSTARPVVQGLDGAWLFSTQICDECQEDCRDPLTAHCERFWKTLHDSVGAAEFTPRRDFDSLAVYKSLVASALLIMPEDELAYFADTLEWVNNPDHAYDGGLFAESYCRIYRLPSASERPWVGLARRVDDEAAFPYMISFLSSRGLVVQTALPMCLRDEDLDGRPARVPLRSLVAGEGASFQEALATILPVKPQPRATRPGDC